MKASHLFPSILGAAALLFGSSAQGALFNYYIGVDGLADIASGTYAGMANPNAGRLTFLYAHTYPASPGSNHYHSKGIYTYTGGASAPVAVVSSSNFLPESGGPLSMVAGTGFYSGKSVADETAAAGFSGIDFRDTAGLPHFGFLGKRMPSRTVSSSAAR